MGHVNREQRWGKTICQCVRASITPSPLIAVRGVLPHSWMIVYKRAPPESYPAEDTGRLLNAESCRLINGCMHFHIQKKLESSEIPPFCPEGPPRSPQFGNHRSIQYVLPQTAFYKRWFGSQTTHIGGTDALIVQSLSLSGGHELGEKKLLFILDLQSMWLVCEVDQ